MSLRRLNSFGLKAKKENRKDEATIAELRKGWVIKKTIDGLQFFYHPASGEVTWDDPADARESDSAEWTWVPHPKDYWQPAKVVTKNLDGSTLCETEDGKKVTIPKGGDMKNELTNGNKQNVPLWKLHKSDLMHVEDDLIMLDNINDGSIIYNLAQRYKSQELYTWVGASHRVLVSINPYQRLPLYGDNMIKMHHDTSPNHLVPPHIFDIADGAYQQMLYEGQAQSILISGESGAGKTEATKQCLKFWAKVAGSKNGVEEKLIQANPVLEAFGNAKTIRNNNSSRFGKWIEVYFSLKDRFIEGATITNFLLEKSRLVSQQPGERNFHIFYQLLSDSATAKKYELDGLELNRYTKKPAPSANKSENRLSFSRRTLSRKVNLKDIPGAAPQENEMSANNPIFSSVPGSTPTTIPDINDAGDFKDTKVAMADLGFSAEEQEWLLRTAAAILHLGNCTFVEVSQSGGVTGSKLENDKPLNLAAKFLKVDSEALRKVLSSRTITVRSESSLIPLDPEAARAQCDSIAKGFYSRMFDWLVTRINNALESESTSGKIIGVLDIFGFEIFEVNSFEQLCINFCNEKLQQLFNLETFTEEEKLYVDEGIKFDHIQIVDSEPVLQMIEKGPNGVLPTLDDECKLEGDDARFMSKLNANFGTHPNFQVDKRRKFKDSLAFEIIHYAGVVNYTTSEFKAKNKDTFAQEGYDLGGNSSDSLTKSLFPPMDGVAKMQVKTLSFVFRNQLNVLMEKLRKTSTRYVRCVKPNETMSPLVFEAALVLRQLRYSGVFEAVAIRKQGFPFRYKYDVFATRFGCINVDHSYKEKDPKKRCQEILDVSPNFKELKNDVAFGKTMILYRAPVYKLLKLLRNLALETIIPRAGAVLRGSLVRWLRKYVTAAEKELKAAYDTETNQAAMKAALANVDNHLTSLGLRLFPNVRPRYEKDVADRIIFLQQLIDEEVKVDKLLETDPNKNFKTWTESRLNLERLSSVPKSPSQKEKFTKFLSILANCEVQKLENRCVDARKRMDRPLLEKCVVEAKEWSHTSDAVTEVKRVLALPEVQFLELELIAAKQMKDETRLATLASKWFQIASKVSVTERANALAKILSSVA